MGLCFFLFFFFFFFFNDTATTEIYTLSLHDALPILRVSRYLTISPGFTTDDPVDQDLGNGARTRNRAFYLGDRISPSANFLIGADYLRWRTDYKGFLRGVDNRVNIFL